MTMLFKGMLLGFSLVALHAAASGQNNKDGGQDQPTGDFCLDNGATYSLISAYLKESKTASQGTPTPPVIDPSCHDCSHPNYTDANQKKIDEFIRKTGDPEMSMIDQLMKMEKQWLLLKSADEGKGALPKCFYQYSEEDFNEKIVALASQVYYKKVTPMFRKYRKNYEYAIGGIPCLLYYARQYIISSSLVKGDQATDDEAMAYAAEWIRTYYDRFQDRLTKQYQYQLFPAFLAVKRQLALAEGGDRATGQELEDYVNRFISFMHFKLKVDFEASGHGDNGGKYHAWVSGETEVRCRLEDNGNCFVWEPVQGNQMEFEVKEVVFQSDQGSATYKLPRRFSVPITLQVNMCDEQPKCTIAFEKFGAEQETYATSDGMDFQSPLLYSLAMATLGSVNLDRMKEEAGSLQQKAEKFKGREGEVDAAAKRLNEHRNDPAYAQSAQGKADMKLMQQMAKEMGYGNVSAPDERQMKNLDHLHELNDAQKRVNEKYKQPGYVGSEEYHKDQAELARLRSGVNLSQLANAAGMDFHMLRIEAPFTLGSARPVDKVQKDRVTEVAGSKGGWEFGQFHVILENAPDKRDNVRSK